MKFPGIYCEQNLCQDEMIMQIFAEGNCCRRSQDKAATTNKRRRSQNGRTDGCSLEWPETRPMHLRLRSSQFHLYILVVTIVFVSRSGAHLGRVEEDEEEAKRERCSSMIYVVNAFRMNPGRNLADIRNSLMVRLLPILMQSSDH